MIDNADVLHLTFSLILILILILVLILILIPINSYLNIRVDWDNNQNDRN